MLDKEDGQALLAPEVFEVGQQASPECGVHAGHGLVEEHHLGLRHERPRELKELLLAARERRRVVVGLVGEADTFEEREGVRPDRTLMLAANPRHEDRRRQALARMFGRAEHDVVEDLQLAEHTRDLERSHEAEVLDPVRSPPRHFASSEGDAPGVGLDESAHDVEERRLASPVRTDERGHGPSLHAHRCAIDGLQAAEPPADAIEREDRLRHRGAVPISCRRCPAGGRP